MTRWAMVADLERCVGCQTCTAACRHANATSPAVQWRKVLDVEAGAFPNVSRTFVPVGCQHCADPPCMHVCPSTATRQRPDGIVTIDYDICIGCAYCDVACPYQARFKITKEDFAYDDRAMQNELEREEQWLTRLGVAQKCTFCSDRIDFGIANGVPPGTDPRATPACVNACIADALHFGDLDNPDSNVSKLLKDHKNFRMHAELKTEPGFYYLYDQASAAPAPETAPAEAQAGRLRTRGVEPWHQLHWDWKAAANFLCGGAGSGLFMFAALVGMNGTPIYVPGLAALALVALGLTMLMFKIGRPLRFLYVLRQPRRSWMTREAWTVAVWFPVALFALWSNHAPFLLLAALLGIFFLFCQGMILEQAKGIPAWRNPRVIAFIMATGAAEGCGLLLVFAAFSPNLAYVAKPFALALLVLIVARAWAWRRYFGSLEAEGAPTRTLEVFMACRGWFVTVGFVLPVVGVAIGLVPPGNALFFAAAGLCALASGWAIKFVLITRAAYNQGFALAHTPVRGSGRPGPAVKPGWTTP